MPPPTTFLRDVPGALAALAPLVTPAGWCSAGGPLVPTASPRLRRGLERVRAGAGA